MKHIDTTTPSVEIDHFRNKPIVSELVGREEFSVVKSVYADKLGGFLLKTRCICRRGGIGRHQGL